ncbi:AEC family transporter [Vallitalea sediminicola]
MDNIIFTINGVLPIFLVILMGYILKRFKLINDEFVKKSTKIVFKVSLPCMIFQSVSGVNTKELFSTEIINLILFLFITNIVLFLLSILLAKRIVVDLRARGPFVQGIVRTNFVIIGYSLIMNLFGDIALAKAALLTAFLVPMYNIMAVIALTIFLPKEKSQNNVKITLVNLAKNPLIISIFVGLIFASLHIELPVFIHNTIEYTGTLTLPLSLICIGAFFSWDKVKDNFNYALIATFLKTIVNPLIILTIAYYLGFRGDNLGIILISVASPTAISSFAMSDAMDNDSQLAAAIIILTTAFSIISIIVGINILVGLT